MTGTHNIESRPAGPMCICPSSGGRDEWRHSLVGMSGSRESSRKPRDVLLFENRPDQRKKPPRTTRSTTKESSDAVPQAPNGPARPPEGPQFN